MMNATFMQMMDNGEYGFKKKMTFYVPNTWDAPLWFQLFFVHVMDYCDYLMSNCRQTHISNIKRLLFFGLYKRMDIGNQSTCWSSLYTRQFQYLRYCIPDVLAFFVL